ncbi:hypothetical protein KA005_18910 [bacterium]|nr:hypothetical protein [bacterium]
MTKFSFMLCGVGIALFAVGLATSSHDLWGASTISLLFAWLIIFLENIEVQ